MLRVGPKRSPGTARLLSVDDDRTLRAAFGRHGGGQSARAASAAFVSRHQQEGGGCWVYCDCRPGLAMPPALVLVSQTHIRRHDEHWPAHSEACDFYRDAAEQATITATYTAAATRRPLLLLRRVGSTSAPDDGRVECAGGDERSGIARLLFRLVDEGGLQRIDASQAIPTPPEQARALWGPARTVEIDEGVPLADFLCTNVSKLEDLRARVAAAADAQFRRNRPHGVLIARMAGVGEGSLLPLSGDPIAVRGRLAVFGERVDDTAEVKAERGGRAPYLAACVLGRASPWGPVEVLSAYVHPCASAAHFMLVDSNLERGTLAQLRRVQDWLGRRRGVRVSIEKPLFDVLPEGAADAPPRPPCIPDFVVRAHRIDGSVAAVAVVETMGFSDDVYRLRKQRLHPQMSAAMGGAEVLMHDFHFPAGLQRAAMMNSGAWCGWRSAGI